MNSFLWTIKRDPPSYFFGTIHVPYTKVWRFVADNAKHAFGRSQRVYFELDLTDPATVSRLNNCQLLPRGARLADVIPRRLYRRLQRHLDHVRVTFAARTGSRRAYAEYLFRAIAGDWRRKRAVWVMLMLNTLTEAEVTSRNVPVLDLYLAQEARRLGKQTGAIERVEEQCMPLNRLNLTQVRTRHTPGHRLPTGSTSHRYVHVTRRGTVYQPPQPHTGTYTCHTPGTVYQPAQPHTGTYTSHAGAPSTNRLNLSQVGEGGGGGGGVHRSSPSGYIICTKTNISSISFLIVS